MRFLKMHRPPRVRITGAGFDEKKTGIFFPEGSSPLSFLLKWDGLQTPEMQSRLRALPFLTGLTRGGVLTSSMLHSHSFVLTKQ